METQNKPIRIETTVHAPIDKVWEYWTGPDHITKWNSASPDWCTPWAKNDLKMGGNFSFRMEAKDGSMGFDFGGVYDEVKLNEYIEYTMSDGRKVKVNFNPKGNSTQVIEQFDPESTNSIEFQRNGWQAILDNFRCYTEEN